MIQYLLLKKESTAERKWPAYLSSLPHPAGTAASAHTELGSPQEFSVGGANITGGPPGSFGRAVNGFIDEVRLSDVALAPSQFHNIPEPGSAVLLLMGISVLLGFRKR